MHTLAARCFWWPTLIYEIKKYVAASTTCARNKSNNKPPAGLLQPLPVPGQLWSHVALDFVTGLPPSQGNTVILTIVDCFSKAAHFCPNCPLPLKLLNLVNHNVRIYGIPMDVVSDHGPQFISQV